MTSQPRWDEFFWDDGTYWDGTPTDGRHVNWDVSIDWNNVGLFDGTNYATYVYGYDNERGRLNFLQSGGNGFEPVMTGILTLQLKNSTGIFNVYNASSPLSGKLTGNQLIRVRVIDESTGTIYTRFTGHIADIFSNYTQPPTATLRAFGNEDILKSATVKTPIEFTIRYDAAIPLILGTAGWNNGQSIDTTVSDSMPYWWSSGNAWNEINDLANAALGVFYITKDGSAKYLSHIAGDSSVVTINDSDVLLDYGVRSPSPREVIKNIITVFARARMAQSTATIWQMTGRTLVATGETKEIWANFSYNNVPVPATTVITPVATTDYTATANSDGTGTDYTSNFSISMPTSAVFGDAAKLLVTNSGTPAYFTCKLRGTAITTDDYTFSQDTDTTSIKTYGSKELQIKTNWLQDLNTAIVQATAIKNQLSTLRQFPRITLRNKPSKQFILDLFNLVTLNLTTSGVTGELRVGYIHETWYDRSGQVADSVIYFEPNLMGRTTGTWIFPAIFGSSTVFA